MADIKCWECDGEGRCAVSETSTITLTCGECYGRKVVTDRRAATANDRAVERIKALVRRESAIERETRWDAGKWAALNLVSSIIEQEAGNDQL